MVNKLAREEIGSKYEGAIWLVKIKLPHKYLDNYLSSWDDNLDISSNVP